MGANEMFSKNSLRGSLGWIFLVVGIICYIIGYSISEFQWKDVFIKIADILVIGAVIGFLTKAAQFLGIFKNELYNVIYGKEFLEQRKDIYPLWETVSKVLFKNKFPTIHKELLKTVNAYLPKDEVSYYNDYEAHTSIEWIDKSRGIIKATDIVSFELIAESSDRFEYPLKTWTTIKTKNSYINKIVKITVNGSVPSRIINKGEVMDKENNLCSEQRIVLSGSLKYEIKYTREKVYNLDEDYYLGLRAKYITNNLRVCLELPDDIEAIFTCRGTQKDFEDVKNTKNAIEKKYKGIVLPRQGYIFALRKL